MNSYDLFQNHYFYFKFILVFYSLGHYGAFLMEEWERVEKISK